VAQPEDKAQQRLQEEAVSDKKLKEELAAQSNLHFQAGRELFARFDYEGAKRELELAVQLDRTNEEARRLLMRVNDILGVRRDRIRSAVAQLHGEYKISIQEKLVELDNRIDLAKHFIGQAQTDPELSLSERIRRYEQAIGALERSKEFIKWLPVEINVDEQSNEANRLLSDSRKAIKAGQARLQEVNREEAAQLAAQQREGERRFLEKKINVMVDQAKALQETGRYEAAMALSAKILEVDPTNAEANTIIAVSKDKNHLARRKFIDEEYLEQYRLNEDRAARMGIPHKDYLVYPENWHEIAQRSSQEEQRARTEEPWKQEIRKKLSRRVTFEFNDTPLEDAIAFLNQLTRVNIILDPKAVAEGANKAPITLRVTDMEMETALRWILRLAELEYDLRNQAVFVTKKANLTGNVEMQIYDVRDLTSTVTDFPGPRIEIGVAQQGQVANPFEQQQQAAGLQVADLQTIIRDRLLPAEFTDPATSIEERQGRLVVMQRPEVHERIRQLLRSFRETQTVQVLTQVRFVDVTAGFLETIGIHFTGMDAATNEIQLPNAVVDPLRQPSRSGIFPIGGGPGVTALPSDIQSSTAYQFQDFTLGGAVPRPPYKVDFGPPNGAPLPRQILLLRPRLDPNFPIRGNATFGPANAPAGFRRQWWSEAFGSPVLVQGLSQNFLRLNPLASALGQSIINAPQQGAMFQFRFLQSVQANAVLQALRKDQTSDQLLAPKLMQFNNQRSHILVAQQTSYIADYDISGAVYDPVVRAFMTGVVLEVRPTVSHDRRYITLDVRPGTATQLTPPIIVYITNSGDVNSGAVGQTTVNLPIELPNLELRSISTTVTVPDNGTMLFSGMTLDRKIDAKSGIPLLSDLPIIGRFFANNNKERTRRNLLVLINARVVLFDEEEANL
jgi:type II secretory pathway component GspD/PulD (secretin)/Flp pilus assembly protein TadD